MPYFTGFAGAFAKRLGENRATEADRAERQAGRENAILSHLATSDDPEIASMALAGLMDQTTGRKRKGLSGFLGEMEGHPALPTIRQLVQAGRTVPDAPPQAAEPPESLAAPGGAALPSGSPVQPTGPRVNMPGPTTFHQEPRQVFLSPEERAGREAEATVTGKLNAFRSGMRQARTPEEQAVVRGLAGAPQRQAVSKAYTVELDDGQGGTYQTAASFDPVTQAWTDNDGTPISGIKRIVPNTQPRQPSLKGAKVQDPHSSTGWSMVYSTPDGKEAYRTPNVTPYTPPPAFSGTTQLETPEGPVVAGLPRGGGAPKPLGTPKATGPSVDQALAQGVVTAVDKEVSGGRIAGLPERPGAREAAVKRYNQKYGKNWTYAQWVAQSKASQPTAGVEGGPPAPPRTLTPGGKKPAGGADPNDPGGLRSLLKPKG